MTLSWEGKALVEGLNSRIDNSHDIDDLQEIIDKVIPVLEAKAPDEPEIQGLRRSAKARIQELKNRGYR